MTTGHPPELNALSTSIQRTLGIIFGEDTDDYRRFSPAADLQWSGPLSFVDDGPPTPLSDSFE
jgi:hypothetical protein